MQAEFLDQKRTQKQTKNEPSEKGEFVGFAINEQKRENQKNFKEILQNHPEIYKVISDNQNLKSDNKIFLEENIELGNRIEELKQKLKNNDTNILKKQNRALEQELMNLKLVLESLKTTAKNNDEFFQELKRELESVKNENKELKKERSILKKVQDKGNLFFLSNENKELRRKLQSVGRYSISDMQIRQIVDLHESGLGYDRIANKVHVSKSTVCKYVNRYSQGKLDLG